MKLNRSTRLASLMYGHGGKYIQSLSGTYDPRKFHDAPAIQVCEIKCGCWIVADGNNRVGLILKNNPSATLEDIPKNSLSIYKYGGWDGDTMKWWNPEPKTFREVMATKKCKPATPDTKGKDVIQGMIERTAHNKFNAVALVEGKPYVASASKGGEAKRLLGAMIKKAKQKKIIALILRPITPMESHRCQRSGSHDLGGARRSAPARA